MAGFDASLGHRSGERSDATFPDAPWSWMTPQSAQLVASPVVADGVLVVGAMDGNVYGLAATTGRLLWQFSTGDAVQGAPAVLDGRVFVASLDGKLYALHLASGRIAWQKPLGGLGRASPVVAAGSLIVARGFPGNTLLRLDPRTGDTMWESAADTLAPFSNSAAASDGTRLIIGANEGHYVAFDLTTGKKQWTYEADGIVNLSAPLLTGGRAYFLPGGASGRLHAVDAATGVAITGWPIDLPAPVPDIAGTSLGRQFAVSSVAAAGSRLIVDLRIDDSLDTDKDGVADQFLMRETVLAIDTSTGGVAWQQANGRKLVSSFNDLPKYWLCPTPAVYERFGSAAAAPPLVLASSTLTPSVRAFSSDTGAVLGTMAAAGPSGASPILANGRAFVATKDGTLHGWLSRSNQPPATPTLTGGASRAVNNVAPIVRWASAVDAEGQPLTYQVRLDSDGEILESWAQATTTADIDWRVPGDLDLGKSYLVAVRARDSQGAWSDWSAPQTLTVEATPPVSLGGAPQPSLAAALQAAHPGQVVSLGAGTMRLGETVRVPAGVTLEGAGPQRTILDATGRDTGVALDGSVAGQATQVRGLTVSGARTGISVESVHDARLANVIVRDSSDAGIDVGASGAAVLRNGTLVANGRGAVSFGTLLVKNSLVLGNQVGLVAGNVAALVSQFNDLSENAVADYQGLTAAATDLAAPVSFLDFDKHDLHLAPRQASTDQGDPADDASAEPAPNGGRINLGAFGGTSEAELSAPPAPVSPPAPDGDGGSGGPDATPPTPTPTNPDPGSPAPTSPTVPASPEVPASPKVPVVPTSPVTPMSPPSATPPPTAAQPSPLTPGAPDPGRTAGGCSVGGEGAGSGLGGTMLFLALAFMAIRRSRQQSAATVTSTRRGIRTPRRWLLAGIVLLAVAWTATARAAARVQFCTGSNNSGSSTSVTCNWPSATTAGNALVAILVECNNGFITPTMGDSGWTQAGAQKDDANLRVRVYYNLNSTSRSTSTWTFGSGTSAIIYMVEYTGISTNSWDQSATNGGTSSVGSTGTTLTLGQAVEVGVGVIAVQGSGNTFSGESITEVTEKSSVDATFGMNAAFVETITNSTSGVGTSANISGTNNWAGVIQTFKATGGGGGGGTTGTWIGAQSGHLWSNAANWANSTIPGANDTVVLNSTGNNAMVIDQDVTVAGFSVNSGYTNSITQSGTRDMTITNDLALAAASGTFTAPTGLLQIGGSFIKTGGITFTHNSGTVMLTSTAAESLATNGATFKNLIINDGLIGYWALDESTIGTAVDSSGYGNDATQHNTPVASTTVPGVDFRDPYSVSFTGTNGNNSTTRYLATGTMPAVLKPSVVTMSAWYRSTGVASQGGEIVSGSNRYALRIYNSTQIKVAKQSASGAWIELTATVSNPLDGNWHHVAGVINGSGMIAYYDGAQVGSNADTAAIFYGTSSQTFVNGGAVGYLNIGRNQDTSNYEFSGNIDEVRLYNRTLSATEISSLAKGRQPGTGSGVYTMTGSPTIAGDLTIASGTLAAGANNLTVSGNWWNYGGLYTSSGNTVTMNGSGTNYIRSAGQVFSNLTFSGAGSAILADRTEIDPGGVLAVTAGTFDLSSYTLRAGNVTRSGSATFTPSTSTVVLDGTSNRTVSAGTFKNLRVEPSSATELAGYWKLDKGQGKTVMDYSGNNHTGTLANTPTWIDTGLPSAITFENNAALSFDGASDYVDLGTNVVTTSAAFTVCTWVNMASLTSNGGYHYFVSKSNNTGATFYLARRGDTTKFAFMMPSTDGGVTTRTDGTTVPSAGIWYHLCGVYDTTHLYVYVNGASEGTPAAFSSGINSTGSTIVGAGKVSGALVDYVNGSMDDVRIYNTALSAAQIAALASGTYPGGLTGAPTYTLGASTTVSGTFALDSGALNTGTGYTMNNSNTSAAALVNAGTYVVGNSASTFSGGLSVAGNGALTMATSGGALKIGSGKTLTINGTFNASSTGTTIQTAGSAGTYYSFQVGSMSGATAVLNITGLTVKNTDTNGMNINANSGATTTFTRFDNIAFSGGTGTQLLKIYAPTLYLASNGCTFDASATASTTYNVSLTGDGSTTETRVMFGGATCASNKASCEAYDNDNDSNGDGIGDTSATNGAVIQWATAAQADTNGTIEGFPTAAFDWNTFTYYATYVTFHDVDAGTADRIYVRDTNGDPQYSWDGPGGTDFVGAPRFDTVSSVHYVYVATASGKVYRLIDNGSSLAQDNTGNWAGTNNPYSCSCTITTPLTLDSTNLYWGGVLTAGSLNKVWTLGKTTRAQAGGTPLTTTALVSGAAPALWASGDTYLFVGETTHFDKLDVTTQSLTTTNASPSGTVNGRITVINSKLFGVDTSGKLWVLNPASSGLPTLWSYHDNTNHNGCTSGVCAVTGSLYVDPATNRAFYGDSDGHLYASYNSSGTTGAQMTGFPYRPGNSSEVYASAPFYNSGVLVVGTTTGSVYVIDINGGSGPVLLQTYKLGPATNISGVAYDKSGGNYMIGAADAAAKDGNIIYIPAVADPTPGSN